MKLINYSKTPKDFNGISYNEYSLKLQDGNTRRLITVTGRVPVVLISASGECTEPAKLDSAGLIPGSDVEFYFDMRDRVSLIEVHIQEPADPGNDYNPF